MLNFDAQRQIRDVLREVDNALAVTIAAEEEVRKQAQSFRDYLFSAFEFIEGESLNYNEIQVQIRRIDNHSIQVQSSKGRMPFILCLNPELAYDSKPMISGQEQKSEVTPPVTVELAARLFAVFAQPYKGLLRYYTIFADGMWKRTTFTISQGRIISYNTPVARFSAELLAREAVDLLGYVCTIHPTWDNLAPRAEAFTRDMLDDRDQIKIHLTGLGIPRHTSKKSE